MVLPCRLAGTDGCAGAATFAERFIDGRDSLYLEKFDCRVRAKLDAQFASCAEIGVDGCRGRLNLDLPFGEQRHHLCGCSGGLGHGIRNVLGALTASRQKDSIDLGGDRSELRVGLHEKSVRAPADPECLSDLIGIAAGRETGSKNNHIHRDLQRRSEKRILGRYDETALPLKNLRSFSPDEVDSFFPHPLVEFLVSFSKGIDVDIELIDLGAGLILRQMGVLHRCHTADPGAMKIGVFIPASDAVEKGDRLWNGSILQQDLSTVRPGRAGEPFELESCEDVVIDSVSILRKEMGIERIIPRCEDDGTHLPLDHFFFLLKDNRFCLAGLDTGLFAFPLA